MEVAIHAVLIQYAVDREKNRVRVVDDLGVVKDRFSIAFHYQLQGDPVDDSGRGATTAAQGEIHAGRDAIHFIADDDLIVDTIAY